MREAHKIIKTKVKTQNIKISSLKILKKIYVMAYTRLGKQ